MSAHQLFTQFMDYLESLDINELLDFNINKAPFYLFIISLLGFIRWYFGRNLTSVLVVLMIVFFRWKQKEDDGKYDQMKEDAAITPQSSKSNHQKKSHKTYQSRFRGSSSSSVSNTDYDDVFDEKTEFSHTKDPSLRRIGLRQRTRPYVR